MLPVLPFVIGGVVGLVAGVVVKTIIDNREEEFVNIEEDISNGGTYTSLFNQFETQEDEENKEREKL
ncbi:hypothetical protein [Aliarcobacter butzleri]|uniref:hypothetical protein n=1 Tax=Aliarcobacter TaxID=2321111 RepID=UPI0021B3AE2C|nr:hypothetical protein [Aliarcobacter butzleri]MCT7584667.1 hypothetical protein [Aliarcobacter butzleri]